MFVKFYDDKPKREINYSKVIVLSTKEKIKPIRWRLASLFSLTMFTVIFETSADCDRALIRVRGQVFVNYFPWAEPQYEAINYWCLKETRFPDLPWSVSRDSKKIRNRRRRRMYFNKYKLEVPSWNCLQLVAWQVATCDRSLSIIPLSLEITFVLFERVLCCQLGNITDKSLSKFCYVN